MHRHPWLAALFMWVLVDAHAAEPPRLAYRVTLLDAENLILRVSVSATGFAPGTQWEPGMRAARAFTKNLKTAPADAAWDIELGAMARREEDPDVATPIPGGALFNDGAVLWRPEDLPDDTRITVHIQSDATHPIAAPWEPMRDGGFILDGMQLNGGAYVVIGPWRALPVKVPGNEVSAVVVGEEVAATPAGLARWLDRSVSMVAAFGGGKMPVPRTQLILLPSGGSKPCQFGTTMRWGLGSIVLFIGGRAEDDAFGSDWVAPHELFHLWNPHLDGRIPWFTEGFTTYYQDVLRARAGARPLDVMWSDLLENFDDACGSAHLQPLRSVSRQLGMTHQYLRVYWGGACTAFLLDVALREASHNERSLDDLYKGLRQQSLAPDGPLDEEGLVKAFHAALPKGHWAHAWVDGALEGRRALPMESLYERLGLRLQGSRLEIRKDAPWAAITAGIMGQSAQAGSWPDLSALPASR